MIKELKPRMKLKYDEDDIRVVVIDINEYYVKLKNLDTNEIYFDNEHFIKEYFEEIKEMKESEFKNGDYVYYLFVDEEDTKYYICKIIDIIGDKVFGYYKGFKEIPKTIKEFNSIKNPESTEFMYYEDVKKLEFPKEEQLHKDDKVKIINGVFKGIEGTIDTILTNIGKLYIFVGDNNESLITVDTEDVELIKKVVPEKATFDELKEASKPLIDFLNKYYDIMTSAIVTEGRVDIVRNEMGVVLEVRD